MLGSGDFEGGGQWDGPVLYCLDQALFSLFQEEDDVPDVFLRQTRAGDDVVNGVVTGQQKLDVGQDLQRTVAPPGNVFGERHDEGVFIGHVDHQRRNVAFVQQPEGIQPAFAADQQIGGRPIGAFALEASARLTTTRPMPSQSCFGRLNAKPARQLNDRLFTRQRLKRHLRLELRLMFLPFRHL